MTAKQDVDMLLYKLSKASDRVIPSLLLQVYCTIVVLF